MRFWVKEKKMNKKILYYPKINGNNACLEHCEITKFGIGSSSCSDCKYSLGSGKNKIGWWIKCRVIQQMLEIKEIKNSL